MENLGKNKKNYFLISALIIFSVFVFSCASTPNAVSGKHSTGAYSEDSEKKTAISHGSEERKGKNYTYFSAVSEEVMHDVAVGTPSSLRRAVQTLRKQSSELTENEKVLIAVESSIMQLVWSNERVDWESPEVSNGNSYMGAVVSARNGIYDTSTGNVDFLTLVLPSLVVLKVSDVSSFYSDSEAALKKGLNLCPDSVLAMYLLGNLYKKAGKFDQASACFKKAFEAAPEVFMVSYAYADSLFLRGNNNEAEGQVNALAAKYPSNTGVLKLASQVYYQKKDYAKAEEYISRVLQQEPNDLPSVLFRARVLIEKKDYIHAASLLDVYSRQDNSSKDYLLLRAQVQNDWSKNSSAAVLTIENALKNYPDDMDVMLYAAKISALTGLKVNGKTAEEYAAAVLEKQSGNETALYYAVEGYVQKKEWQKAYEISSKLVSVSEKNKDAVSNHVKICLALKKYDEAWTLVSVQYRLYPSDEEVLQSYIKVMAASGKTQQALGMINQNLSSSSSKMKSFLYYQRSFLQSSEDSVLSDLRSSLIANPRNSEALFRLYEIYYDKADYRKAQYYLKQVVALNPNDSDLRARNEKLTELIK